MHHGDGLIESEPGGRWLHRITGMPITEAIFRAIHPSLGFKIIRRLREELKVNTTCGASNISFGLPARNGLNAAFLSMAMGAGMTSAITSPLHEEVIAATMGGDVMMGHDRDCARWIKRFRPPPVEGVVSAGAGRRGGRRHRG